MAVNTRPHVKLLSAVEANVKAFIQTRSKNNRIGYSGKHNKENMHSPCRITNVTESCLISLLNNFIQTANFFIHRNCKVIAFKTARVI